MSTTSRAAVPIARFKPARANIDYNVELDSHYYSVPHALVGEPVELRIIAGTLEVLHGSKRVAAQPIGAGPASQLV